jgi:peptidoglycan/LPS O-acetylase OafA/YrhL
MASSRISSLDGLRGLAALLVVLGHSSLLSAYLAHLFFHFTFSWSAFFMPLGLPGEAVPIFFVLSGFVLARAYTPRVAASPRFLASRFVRLFVPIWGAFTLGILAQIYMNAVAAQPGFVTPEGDWAARQLFDFNVVDIIRNFAVVDGVTSVNSSLWTMQYEILFSLILPAVIVFADAIGSTWKRWLPIAVGMGVLVWLSEHMVVGFVAMFAAGAIMSKIRMPASRWWMTAPLLVVGITLFAARRLLQLFFDIAHARHTGPWMVTVTLAALILMYLANHSPTVGRVFAMRVPQYLGQRSYSIYLVQAPVILAVGYTASAFLPRQEVNPWLMLFWSGGALVLALLVGEAFYRLVEKPSIRLVARIKKRADLAGAAVGTDT